MEEMGTEPRFPGVASLLPYTSSRDLNQSKENQTGAIWKLPGAGPYYYSLFIL